jgi:hypothetical protein
MGITATPWSTPRCVRDLPPLAAGLYDRAVAEIDADARIVRRAGALTAAVDEELVMLDPEESRYYGLNDVGASIWELLERPSTVAEICGKLTEEYRVAPELCREQVSDFVQQLVDAGLVQVA